MRLVPAVERLTKLDFQADTDWNSYPASVYTCPGCGERTGFVLKDLDRHSHSRFTNLTPSDALAAAETAARSDQDHNSFLDFYCPGCHAPVRLYYVAWAGGRWTYGHELRFVVEGSPISPETRLHLQGPGPTHE